MNGLEAFLRSAFGSGRRRGIDPFIEGMTFTPDMMVPGNFPVPAPPGGQFIGEDTSPQVVLAVQRSDDPPPQKRTMPFIVGQDEAEPVPISDMPVPNQNLSPPPSGLVPGDFGFPLPSNPNDGLVPTGNGFFVPSDPSVSALPLDMLPTESFERLEQEAIRKERAAAGNFASEVDRERLQQRILQDLIARSIENKEPDDEELDIRIRNFSGSAIPERFLGEVRDIIAGKRDRASDELTAFATRDIQTAEERANDLGPFGLPARLFRNAAASRVEEDIDARRKAADILPRALNAKNQGKEQIITVVDDIFAAGVPEPHGRELWLLANGIESEPSAELIEYINGVAPSAFARLERLEKNLSPRFQARRVGAFIDGGVADALTGFANFEIGREARDINRRTQNQLGALEFGPRIDAIESGDRAESDRTKADIHISRMDANMRDELIRRAHVKPSDRDIDTPFTDASLNDDIPKLEDTPGVRRGMKILSDVQNRLVPEDEDLMSAFNAGNVTAGFVKEVIAGRFGIAGAAVSLPLKSFASSGKEVLDARAQNASEAEALEMGNRALRLDFTSGAATLILMDKMDIPDELVDTFTDKARNIGIEATVEGVKEGGVEFLKNRSRREIFGEENQAEKDPVGVGTKKTFKQLITEIAVEFPDLVK